MTSSKVRGAAERTAVRAAEQAQQAALQAQRAAELWRSQVQSAELRERLTPVVEQATLVAREQAAQAALAARVARGKAAPRVAGAVDWAGPRIEKGLASAGPRVEAAAERVSPAVDAARDRIVEDLLPRLVEAVNTATAAGIAAQRAAAEKVNASVLAATQQPVETPSPSHRGRRLVIFGTLATAGVAAGAAALRRSRSGQDGWESVPDGSGGSDSTPAYTGTAASSDATTSANAPVVAASPTGAQPDDGSTHGTQGDPLVPAASSSGAAGSADAFVETVDDGSQGQATLTADAAASHTADDIILAPDPGETVQIVDVTPAELVEDEPAAPEKGTSRRRRSS